MASTTCRWSTWTARIWPRCCGASAGCPRTRRSQIARQLCAGLAAAHEQGVLHRDLKPANVMIDGRGRAKITDFGLAGLAGTIEGDEVRAGTPHYMAPEQLPGDEVTVRSDIYALGLVLYELFTGRRAFEAATPAELARLQNESAPTSPSSHVDGTRPRRRAGDPALPGAGPRPAARSGARRCGRPARRRSARRGAGRRRDALAGDGRRRRRDGRAEPVRSASPAWSWCVVGLALIASFYGERDGFWVGFRWTSLPRHWPSTRARSSSMPDTSRRRPTSSTASSTTTTTSNTCSASSRHRRCGMRWRSVRPAPVFFWYRQSPEPMVAAETIAGAHLRHRRRSTVGRRRDGRRLARSSRTAGALPGRPAALRRLGAGRRVP